MDKLIGVTISPRIGFQSIYESDLKYGILIVLVVSIFSAWAGATYFMKTELNIQFSSQLGPFSHGGPNFFRQGEQDLQINSLEIKNRLLPFIFIGGFLGGIIRWLVPSILVILVAKIFIGDGSSRRMLTMTGFGFLPMLLQHLLRLIDALTISPTRLSVFTASQLTSNNFFWKIVIQSISVFTVFGLLNVFLSIHAISQNYETQISRATIVTILSHFIYVLLRSLVPII